MAQVVYTNALKMEGGGGRMTRASPQMDEVTIGSNHCVRASRTPGSALFGLLIVSSQRQTLTRHLYPKCAVAAGKPCFVISVEMRIIIELCQQRRLL